MSTLDQFALSRVNTPNGAVFQPSSQAGQQLAPVQDVFKVVASQSATPQWGSFADFLVQPSDFSILNDVLVRIDVGAITGITGNPSFVNDGNFLLSRVEVSIAEKLVDVWYPEAMYAKDLTENITELKNRFFRLSKNDTLANRKTNATAAQSFYITVPSFWTVQPGFFLRALNGPIKIRVVLANLGDVVQVNAGTGTAAATVNAVSLIASGREYKDQSTAIAQLTAYRKVPSIMFRYMTPIQMSKQSLVAGSATYGINLTSIQGWISHLFVIVRTTANVSTSYANSPDTFASLASLNIKTTGGALITGGSELLHDYALNYSSTLYWPGDLTDVMSGLGGTPKSIYTVSFAQDPMRVIHHGAQMGGFHFTGSEILNLTFASALGANNVVDVIAFQYAALGLDNHGNAAKI